ncbi:MAG: right-handed parallel beta-helix repeat-containing protein [Acidimicrobiales bacterium]
MSARRRAAWVAVAGVAILGSVALPARAEPGAGPPALRLVIAPAGQGAACTDSQPCSIGSAQARVRGASATRDVDVVVGDGTYTLAQPIELGAADGGRQGHHVLYGAAPGAHPVWSGGIQITGWRPDPKAGLWSASVPPGTASRELYVDGKRAPRTTEAPPGAWIQTASGYTTTDTSVLTWRNPSSVELVFNEGNGFWTEPRCDVVAVAPTAGGANVVLRQPCWSNLHIPDTPAAVTDVAHATDDNAMGGFEGLTAVSPPSAIENVFADLSTPGEWYLDEPGHTLYYKPLAGQTPSSTSAVLPVLESLVTGRGTLDAPVANLEFRGLTFAYTTWLQPSGDDGFAEMQANVTLRGRNASGSDPASGRPPQGTCQYTIPAGTCPFAAWSRSPAAVTFHAGRGVVVDANTFTHLGAAGATFDYGSQGNLVQGNEITDTSGSGIQVGDTTDPAPADLREINDGNTISDNWIHDIAAEYHGGIGIWVGYTRHTLIAHNQIERTPYTAISLGWGGWHTDTLHPDNPSITSDNTVADNLISDYLMTLPDGGAIYTNGVQGPPDPTGPAADPFLTPSASVAQMRRGLTISGNVALLATWSEFAYYNDEGSDYITYDGNAEYQAHLFAHGGCNTVGHILIAHNYWAQPTGGYICPPPPVDVNLVDHHPIPDHPGPGDIPESLLAHAGLEPAFRALVTSRPPEVTGVGPQAGPTPLYPSVLVSGSGFTADTTVLFGSVKASAVRVLSANYLVATPPSSGAPGLVDVVAETRAGSSAVSSRDQFAML